MRRSFAAAPWHHFELVQHHDPGGAGWHTIRHRQEIAPVTGQTIADVASVGWGMSRRATLTIAGPGYSWSAPLGTFKIRRAQQFAAAVNVAARLASAAAQPPREPGSASGSAPAGTLPG
jgi:hypothetical protein